VTDLADLRAWAEAHAPSGCVQARQVLTLLDYLAHARKLALRLAERCERQSELLGRKAEK
jgi:hypothetical protein